MFFLSCDDKADLFLGTDRNPINKILLSHCPEWAEAGNYSKFSSQKSRAVRLIAEKSYYISVVHKEDVGGDYLSVSWLIPGRQDAVIVPGKNLSPYPGGRKGRIGHEIGPEFQAPPIKGTPKVAVTSANDPTKPVPGGVRWFWRDHQKNLQRTKANNFDLCFLGDSITQGWPGDLLNQNFEKYRPANFGIGGDRAENVLFRLENGELANTDPKAVVVLLGINNLGIGNTPGEAALGVALVLRKIRSVVPQGRILLLGVFPTQKSDDQTRVHAVNEYLAKVDDGKMICYLTINSRFMNKEDKLCSDLFRDVVHLNRGGSMIWSEGIREALGALMK